MSKKEWRIRCPIKRDDLCTAQAWHNQRGDCRKVPDDTGRSGTNVYQTGTDYVDAFGHPAQSGIVMS